MRHSNYPICLLCQPIFQIENCWNLVELFDKAIEPIVKLIVNLQRKNANLRQTRDLLLPRLISGELDVSRIAAPS
jgi:hypothetical protein